MNAQTDSHFSVSDDLLPKIKAGVYDLAYVEHETVSEPLTPGDRVELGFTVDGDIVREYLWVRVFAQLHDGKAYLGSLEASPVIIEALSKGDQVTFLPRHIIKYKKASFFRGGFA